VKLEAWAVGITAQTSREVPGRKGLWQETSISYNNNNNNNNNSIDWLQKTAILGISHIIRKVLQCEAWSLSGGDHRWFKGSTRKKRPVTRDDNNNNNNNNIMYSGRTCLSWQRETLWLFFLLPVCDFIFSLSSRQKSKPAKHCTRIRH